MPVTFSVRVENAELVRAGLQNLDREIPRIGARQIYQAVDRARKKVTTYPPELPNQRYKRTGRYGRAFTIRRNPQSGIRKTAGYSLIGRAVDPKYGREYTRWVGGGARGERQARIHQGRWSPIRETVIEEVDKLPAPIAREISYVARRNGL